MLKVFRITKDSYTIRGNQATMFFHPPERHFQQINIGAGSRETDKKQLDTAGFLLQEIVRTQDTVHGVYFHFEKQATYGALVQALNWCVKTKAICFLDLENDIRAYFPVQEKLDRQICTSILVCGTAMIGRERQKAHFAMERRSDQVRIFRQYIISFWPVGLIFLFLILSLFLPALHKRDRA